MGQLRFTIINYSDEGRNFEVIVTGNDTNIYRCKYDGPIKDANMKEYKATATKDQSTRFTVEKGAMYGFIAGDDTTLCIENPDRNIMVFTAAGKNPWPIPPQASSYYSPMDFNQRFKEFNHGDAAGPATTTSIKYVLQQAPACSPQVSKTGQHK